MANESLKETKKEGIYRWLYTDSYISINIGASTPMEW